MAMKIWPLIWPFLEVYRFLMTINLLAITLSKHNILMAIILSSMTPNQWPLIILKGINNLV